MAERLMTVDPTKCLALLVVASDPGVCSSIEAYLTGEFEHMDIGYTGTLSEASRKLMGPDRYDVLLVDTSTQNAGEEQLFSWIMNQANTTPVILLTDDENSAFITESSSLGYSLDYLPKSRLDSFSLNRSIKYCLDRKQFRRCLNESEKQYRELFVINPVPMYIYDMDTYRFLDVNEAAITTYGYSKEEFLTLTIKDIRPGKELPRLEKILQEQTVSDELSYRGIFTHLTKKGDRIQVEIQSKFTNMHGKKVKLVLANNVTERLKNQEALRLSEQRFKSLVQDGSDLISILDENAIYQYVSPTSTSVLGIPPNTFIGTSAIHYIHYDDRARVIEELAELPKKKHIRLTPFRYMDNNKNWRWLESTITYMLDDPVVCGIVTNSRDITEKVEQELKLRESVARYDIISKATSDIIWDLDISKNAVIYNEAICDMFGYKETVVENAIEWWKSKIHPDDLPFVLDKLGEVLKGGINRFQFEYRFLCANGTYKYIYDRASAVTDENGKPIRLIGAMQDITELLKKEKELQKANDQLKIAQKIAKMGYWTHDLREKRLTWSDEAVRIWEFDPEAVPETFDELLTHIHPDNKELLMADREQTFPGDDFTDIEYRILIPGGRIKWIMSRVTLHKDEDGKPCLVEGVSQDITEKKQREIKLKETIARYDILSRATSDAIWDVDVSNDIVQYNQTFQDMFGYKSSEIENSIRWWRSKIHPDDRQKVVDEVHEAYENRTQRLQLEFRFKCADGSYKYIYDRAFLVIDENCRPVRMTGAMQDMTELLTKKIELQKANEQLKTAHKIAKMGYWTADFANKSGEWSEELCKIYGVDPGTFKPSLQTWMETIHPDDLETVREHYQKLLDEKKYYDFDHRIITPDGQVKWLLERVTLHRNDDGAPQDIEGITQDITERKLQEANILASLKEKETLLAEIHHRVKNNLAVVSSLIQLQAFKEENPALSIKLMDSVSRIKTMAIIHEQLYQSNSFANLEFCQNVRKLVLSIIETLQTGTHIRHSFHCEPTQLNIKQAIPCALIVNEVTTNILKHAFKGRKEGEISIYLSAKGKQLSLKITDNGNGMPENLDPASGKTLGLHLIDTLTRQLEANYHFDSSEGKGTSFVLQFVKS